MAKWQVRKWETVKIMSYTEVEADNEYEAIAQAQEDELNMIWDGEMEYPEEFDNDDEWYASELEGE